MLLAPFLWIFCEFDEKVLDNSSLVLHVEYYYSQQAVSNRPGFSIQQQEKQVLLQPFI